MTETEDETRVVNGRTYVVTHVPAEDVDEVRARSGVAERVGKRPMVTVTTSDGLGGGYQGRMAPRHIGERH